MRHTIKITAVFFSVILIISSLFLALNSDEVEARGDDEICEFFHPNLGDCDPPPINCFCEIIVEPDK